MKTYDIEDVNGMRDNAIARSAYSIVHTIGNTILGGEYLGRAWYLYQSLPTPARVALEPDMAATRTRDAASRKYIVFMTGHNNYV